MISFSANQISKAVRCWRLVSWEYVHGIRPLPTRRQDFGKLVHEQLARWLRFAIPPDNSPEGQVAKQGLALLPPPNPKALVERKTFYAWGPGQRMIVIPDWASPLDIGPDEIPLICDHKTTSDLKWAKTPDQLVVDEQAIIYAVWAMLTYRRPVVRGRWVYYASSNPKKGYRKPQGTRKVEVEFNLKDPDFMAQVDRVAGLATRIREIRTDQIQALSLPPSPESCELFDGCDFRDCCKLEPADRLVAYMEKEEIHNG